jgi:hypothetical protein
LCSRHVHTYKLCMTFYSPRHAGPDYAVEAALAFFGALRVYPSPVELIVIFQKTVPDFVFKVCGFAFHSRLTLMPS